MKWIDCEESGIELALEKNIITLSSPARGCLFKGKRRRGLTWRRKNGCGDPMKVLNILI